MNLLITGRPGAGKTTLVKKFVQNFAGRTGGFYTEEIREKGIRTGFAIRTLDGKSGILAGVRIKSPHRVGKYGVNLKEFEKIAVSAVESALAAPGTIIIIDEIGPMELFSGKFRDIVVKALDSPNPVIATVKLRGAEFINALRSRCDVMIYDLTFDNSEDILRKILSAVETHDGEYRGDNDIGRQKA